MIQADPLIHRDGSLHLYPDFLPSDEATRLFKALRNELAWAQESIKLFGKQRLVPRLICWYGDNDISYRYSGVNHQALPWSPLLLILKQQLEKTTQHTFNGVLGNLYRNGKDSMGWHTDNEKEMGETPYVASISLGAERIFKARHKDGETVKLTLGNGSLLTMSGSFQKYWQHCIPKTSIPTSARINLTFRYIFN